MAAKKPTGKGEARVREVRITHDQRERIFNLVRFGLSDYQVADKVDLPRQVVAAVVNELEKSGRLELVNGKWTEGATWRKEQDKRKREHVEKREREKLEKRKAKPNLFQVAVFLVALSLFLLVVEHWDTLKGIAALLGTVVVLWVLANGFFRILFKG